ncbi:MAG: L-threonylcarbamoyladenylate synthase [Eubacteriales bacterium]|nr:L-threonylcarbamoyladenylate synthase [Eubacteriales bacterium]
METRIIVLDDFKKNGIISENDLVKIGEAAAVLRNGGLVAFPTETVYGLGGDARTESASERIYAAKGRPSDNPLIVHISKKDEIYPLIKGATAMGEALMDTYWPGPLTLVFPKSDVIPKTTTGGLDTVAVRCPEHPVANKLIELAGVPVAAPSANRSGRPSTTRAEHCIEDLMGRVDVILDGGPCEIGVESTIVDLTGETPMLLRPGAVTAEMIKETIGLDPVKDKALTGPLKEGERPKAPGMKYRHYAPKAPLVLVTGEKRAVWDKIREMSLERENAEIICSRECAEYLEDTGKKIRVLGAYGNEDEIARSLFAVLRETDSDEIDMIIAEGFSENDLGLAIMNRLKKAAGWTIIKASS